MEGLGSQYLQFGISLALVVALSVGDVPFSTQIQNVTAWQPPNYESP